MSKIVTIIGTDGSGKTTLCKLVQESLSATGLAVDYEWLGSESVLMRPVRSSIRRIRRHSQDGIQADSMGRASKAAFANRHATLIPLYLKLALLDYRAQVAFKRWRSRDAQVVLADRYLHDVCVNLALTLGWTPEEAVASLRRLHRQYQLPAEQFYLRTTPELSMQRKADIPDISYVESRLSYYDAIAEAFGFQILDGGEPLETNRDLIVEAIHSGLDRPYVHYVHANNTDVGGADIVLASMVDHAANPTSVEVPSFRTATSLREETRISDRYSSSSSTLLIWPFLRLQSSRGRTAAIGAIARAPLSLIRFIGLFRREKPDIVHVNDIYDILPAVAARLTGSKVVFHLRMIKEERLSKMLLSSFIRRVSHASISVSEAVRHHYFDKDEPSAHVIHDLGNSDLLHHASDARLSRPGSVGQDGRLVLMVGRLDPWKGQDLFVKAVELLPQSVRESNTFCLIGGRVPGKQDFAESVQRDAAAAGITVLGERNDIANLLRAAHISVHSSVAPDPFPGVVIESMLAGCAVIASDAGGVPEMIEHGQTGLLVEPGNAELLAVHLEELLRRPELPGSIGRAARSRALDLVEPSRIEGEIADLYLSLLERPRKG